MLECTTAVPALGRIRAPIQYLAKLKAVVQSHLEDCTENSMLCPVCSNLDTRLDSRADEERKKTEIPKQIDLLWLKSMSVRDYKSSISASRQHGQSVNLS